MRRNLKNLLKDSNFNLFPTSVLYCPNFISDQERVEIFKKLCKLDSTDHGAILGGKSSHYFENDLLSLLDIQLKSRIQNKLDNYTNTVGIRPVKIDNSWFNIQDVGSFLKYHTHPSSVVSAVLYINVDENSSKLSFKNPNQVVSFSWTDYELDNVNLDGQDFFPKNGDMYIFPSWLEHGSDYDPNGTVNRTSISLNTFWS